MRSALVVVALLLATASLPAFAQDVAIVVDGDTLKFGSQRVRLYGIDAPELHQTCDGGSWAAGKLAREALAKIIGDRSVTCVPVIPDGKYKRPISTCTVGQTDIASAMAEQGWAWAFTRYSDKYVDQEKRAHTKRAGLHGHDCTAAWEWRAAKGRKEKPYD